MPTATSVATMLTFAARCFIVDPPVLRRFRGNLSTVSLRAQIHAVMPVTNQCDQRHKNVSIGDSAGEGDPARLAVHNAFQRGFILDDNRRASYLQELLLLEIGKQPRHGLSGGPDHLGDLPVCEGEREPYLAFSFLMVCGEIQQEARQLVTCGMIGLTELLRHAQCCFAMLA